MTILGGCWQIFDVGEIFGMLVPDDFVKKIMDFGYQNG